MAQTDLDAIRTKVRRLTRSPSVNQISDGDIDEYVNTFVLYDFPSHLRLFTLRTTFEFFTEPYIDVYETNNTAGDPFNNFKNKYVSVHKPMYIAGREALVSQSREQFFALYPLYNSIRSIGTNGDGVTTAFSGTLADVPVLRNQVLFSSIDGSNNGLELHDDGTGTLTGDGSGTIDYVTGAFTLNFSTAPGSGERIDSQTRPYVASRPDSILYFDNTFTLRPVPDKPYRVSMEVYVRPTELLAGSDEPDLNQWWQYIAYGAAKKILEDRTDLESVQRIMPEFKEQEKLVLRKTIVEQTKERVATIYTDQVDGRGDYWRSGFGEF